MTIAILVAGAPLRIGSQNAVAVKAVQAALHQPQTGEYDSFLAEEVAEFQRVHGLGVDGIVGPVTARALDATAGVQGLPQVHVTARSDFGSAPIWFQWALHEVGVHEVGNNAGPDIKRYIDDAHVGAIGWPWCAEFINAALEANGVPGTRSASSQSFLSHQNFVRLAGPALGAITVFGRAPKGQGLGHVTFYRGETPDRIYGLGGNQADAVSIESFPRAGSSMWFEAYCWPKGVPLPVIGAIPIRSGQPLAQVKVV